MTTPVTTLDARYSAPNAIPTSWEQTCRVLEAAQVYWITTVRADGRPHVTPCAAVWLDGALYFDTGINQQKAFNLEANRNVVLTTGCNQWETGLDVVVTGEAVQVSEDEKLAGLAKVWATRWAGGFQFVARDGYFLHAGNESAPKVAVFSVKLAKVYAFTRGPGSGHTTHTF